MVDVSGGGSLSTGIYRWLVTFVTALGETEAGVISTSVTAVAGDSASLTAIPISPSHSVTSRKIYRTTAGGSTFGLVTTLANNTTTTFLDTIADGSLGVAPPTVLTAVTGMEQFPVDAQERLFVNGLRFALATTQGDLRDNKWRDEWKKDVQRFWGEYKQGANEPMVLPRYGVVQGIRGGYWPRWT